MNINDFIKKHPYLYHLTDARNVVNINKVGRIFSTNTISNLAGTNNPDELLSKRRAQHEMISINGTKIHIRDQRPLNKALDNCLTDGWSAADFIRLLNQRVFLWPNLKRLTIHFDRYSHENPIIFRFLSEDILQMHPEAQFSRINSGATRPTGALGGKAALRGPNTFQEALEYEHPPRTVAEVTIPTFCNLPVAYWMGDAPWGPWKKVVRKPQIEVS